MNIKKLCVISHRLLLDRVHLVCCLLRFNRSKDPGGATPPPSVATTPPAPPRGLAIVLVEPGAAPVLSATPAPDISAAVPAAMTLNRGTGRRASVATVPPPKCDAAPPELLEEVTATATPLAATLCSLLPLLWASAFVVASVENTSAGSSLEHSVAADAAVVVGPVEMLLLLLPCWSDGMEESKRPPPTALPTLLTTLPPLPLLFVFVAAVAAIAATAAVAAEKHSPRCVPLPTPSGARPPPLSRSPPLTPPALGVEDVVLLHVVNFSA